MFLNDDQVAQRYGVTPPTIWRWVKTDAQFPRPVKLSPGCTRWRREELEAWEVAKAKVAG